MIKILILILLCMTTFTGITQKHQTNEAKSNYDQNNLNNDLAVVLGEKPSERRASEKEFAAWNVKLNNFLLASDDDFAQALTLANIISGVQTARLRAQIHQNNEQVEVLNEISYQPLADLLNQLINKSELSIETYDILTKICFEPEMADHCHANVLLEKRMQQDTTNLHAYLRPFGIAAKTNNQQSMHQLIQLMASIEHSRSSIGITNNMRALIDEFIDNNPIPQSAIDNMVEDYKKLSGVSPEIKPQLSQLMPAYMPAHIKFGYQYLYDTPPYKALLNYCKTHIVAVDYCRDIAQIMIQKSNSMIDKGLGHSLLIATYELERNQAGVNAAQQLHDKFKHSYECIRGSNNNKYFIDDYFDPEYQAINQNTSEEFETLILLAELRYKNLKTQNVESAIDPQSCFQNN